MLDVKDLFLPGRPIARKEMLVGRTRQLNRILSILSSGGRAVVITGTRGIGKTSLANVAANLLSPHVSTQCHSRISFSTWALQLLQELGADVNAIERTVEANYGASFAAKLIASIGVTASKKSTTKERGLPNIDITPDVLLTLLTTLSPRAVITIDEFDRIPPKEEQTIELFGDFIKLLGNRADIHQQKLIFIGVGSSAARLFHGHPSIKRNVAPIHLNRLSQRRVGGQVFC